METNINSRSSRERKNGRDETRLFCLLRFWKFFSINNQSIISIAIYYKQQHNFDASKKRGEEERTCKTGISEKWKFHAFM